MSIFADKEMVLLPHFSRCDENVGVGTDALILFNGKRARKLRQAEKF